MRPGHLILTSTYLGRPPDPVCPAHRGHPRSPRSRVAPHSTAQSSGTLLGFKSPIWCLMSAFVTTLGIFNLRLLPPVSVFTFLTLYLLAGSLSSAALAWGVSPTFQPRLPPPGRPAQGRQDLPSTCRPPGCALCVDVCLAESHTLDETEVGCGGGSQAGPPLWRGCAFRGRVGSCHHRGHRGHAAPRPAHIQTHRPVGTLTLDDEALFVNMLLICNFENKIETSCILRYEMKCDALYTI